MALHRILVVDDSPAVRETLGILLGANTTSMPATSTRSSPAACTGATAPSDHRRQAEPATQRRMPAPRVPVLWLEDAAEPAAHLALTPGAALPRPLLPASARARVGALLARPPAGVPPAARWRACSRPSSRPTSARVAGRGDARPLAAPSGRRAGRRQALHGARRPRGARRRRVLARSAAAPSTPRPLTGAARAERSSSTASNSSARGGQQALLAVLDAQRLDARRRRRAVARGHHRGSATSPPPSTRAPSSPGSYYRLTVLTAHVPPLRERPADIAPLADQLARRSGGRARPAARAVHRARHRAAVALPVVRQSRRARGRAGTLIALCRDARARRRRSALRAPAATSAGGRGARGGDRRTRQSRRAIARPDHQRAGARVQKPAGDDQDLRAPSAPRARQRRR